jgi:hypothetical protein
LQPIENKWHTLGVSLASDLHFPLLVFRETVVIIFAIVAALAVLVAVTFISSIDFSKTRRH